jgi:uncharacterized surface protein with fasciclin (FAS1) repeats
MKIILLSLFLCSIITTGKGQSVPLLNKTVVENATEAFNPEKNIAANISGWQHSTLFSKALQSCNLEETFSNPGPITLFLPPDSAFRKLSPGKIDTLLMPERKYDLISILTYHALPGNVRFKDIAKHIRRGKGKTSLHTIAGAWLIAEYDNNGDIILTDEKGGRSTILKSNLKQKNGIIHLVSSVLMPNLQSI